MAVRQDFRLRNAGDGGGSSLAKPVSNARNREFFEILRSKQAFGGLTAVGLRKFARDRWWLADRRGTFLLLRETGHWGAITGNQMRNVRYLEPLNR
jgi:hypothetical protein